MAEFLNIILLVVVIIIGLLITGGFYGFRRGNTLAVLLKQGRYEEALEQINRQLEQHKDQADKVSLVAFLSMQKAEIRFFLGDFDSSLALLEQVVTKDASMPLRLWHTTLKLQNLLLLGETNEAKEFYQANISVLEPVNRDRLQVANTLEFAQALYLYYLGDFEESKLLFEKLIKRSLPKRYLAVSTYYLGEIDIKHGQKEAATLKREQARIIDEHVFVNRR